MTTQVEKNFMIDCIVTDLATFIIRDYNLSEADALRTIYSSEYFERLSDPSTGFYTESSLYNYHYLRHELEYGKIA